MTGRTVVITGAARGIGAAVASRFAAAGDTLALLDHRSDLLAEQTAAIRGATGHVVDLADAAAIADAAAAIAAAGTVDVLVNNAGTILPKGLEASTVAEWDHLMAVNLRAPFLLTIALAPALRAARGCVVNVASTAGLWPQPDNGPYCVSKAGVVMLTRSLAVELAPDVRVSCVCPGATRTPLLAEYAEIVGADLGPIEAAGLLVEPEDVAEVIADLVAARGVTGAIVPVDAGASLR